MKQSQGNYVRNLGALTPTPSTCRCSSHSIRRREALHYLAGHCTSYYPVQCSPSSALLLQLVQRFGATSSATVRTATPTLGITPLTGRCTPYGALHPFRTGALPTDRVHRPHQQAQTRTCTPHQEQAVHHPPLRRTSWTDIALLTRQRNAPHLAQHSHSQA